MSELDSVKRATRVEPPAISLPRLVHDVAQAVVVKRDRLIRLQEVLRLVGVGKSTYYNLMTLGLAPQSVKVTPRCVAWSEAEVLSFVQDRLAEARRNTDRQRQLIATSQKGRP